MHELFEAFGVEWKLLIAQAVNFGIVLVGLWYFLYKPVMKIVDERQQLVEKGVQDAHKAEEFLAAADQTAGERLQTAEREAEHIVSLARKEAGTKRAELVQEAERRAEHIEKEAQARAAQESAKFRRESEREIARLAVLAAEKALKNHD